ncbi:hypothetical protein, partial [Methylococcus sp. S1B]|uniref:hypothetical protein n=1 Tax=Methylococcus sp. S1B TaxID=3435347 RepID=UPI003D7D264A
MKGDIIHTLKAEVPLVVSGPDLGAQQAQAHLHQAMAWNSVSAEPSSRTSAGIVGDNGTITLGFGQQRVQWRH